MTAVPVIAAGFVFVVLQWVDLIAENIFSRTPGDFLP